MTGRAYAVTALPHATVVVSILCAVAYVSPAPHPTDQGMMERVGRGVIVDGCADLNCFRMLVPSIVERLPGPSLPRWRGYAVACNAAAAVAAGWLALQLGLGSRVALITLWLAALGSGSFATINHPYNNDPLVWLLAPLITALTLQSRILKAALLALVGIFAKEFAAAPLYIAAAASAIGRQWRECLRQAAAAVAVTAAWLALQLALILAFNYSYDNNPSSQVQSGGYLRVWLAHVTPLTGALAIFGTFGALYVLLPSGWQAAPATLRRLALGAIPAAAAFVYVATPERVLWNFFFIVVPIAAIALAMLPTALVGAFIVMFAAANLRIGAQVSAVPASRYAVIVTLLLAVLAITWPRLRPLNAPA